MPRTRSPSPISVLVVSFDAYSDLWRPFFTLFHRYWPDCPYPVYLGSNARTFPNERVQTLTVGREIDWSTRFAELLRRLDRPHVLVLLEDYLLSAPVDTARVERLFEHMTARGAACMRLIPVPGAPAPDPGFSEAGELPRGMPYRVSTQAAIWSRDALLELVRPGESIWDFETAGTPRSEALEAPFLSVVEETVALPYFCTAIYRGRWLRDAVAFCRREEVDVDLAARPQESRRAYIARKLRLKRLRHALGAWTLAPRAWVRAATGRAS